MSGTGKRRFAAGRVVLAVVVLLVALVALVLWLRAPADPLYKGKRLSRYLYDAAAPFPAPVSRNAPVPVEAIREYNRKQSDAAEATKALGARAIPLLSAWWDSDSGLHEKLRNLAMKPGSRFGGLLRWQWISMDLHAIAANALIREVPEHAASFLPDLRIRMLENKLPRSDEAAQLFARILLTVPVRRVCFEENRNVLDFYTTDLPRRVSDTAVQVIASIVRHGPPEDAERLVRRLWLYRERPFSNVGFVISSLDRDGFIQNLLYLEDGKPTEKPAAALYFRDRPRAPERVVPLLVTNLTPGAGANLLQSVCDALAAYGANATPALPQLTNLLAHPRPLVRQAAERAIERIGKR